VLKVAHPRSSPPSGGLFPDYQNRQFYTFCSKSLASLVSFEPFVKTGYSSQKGVAGKGQKVRTNSETGKRGEPSSLLVLSLF